MSSATGHDWRKDSYYLQHHVRLRTIAATLRDVFGTQRGVRVLDVGCGAALLRGLLGDAFDYYGCDGHAPLFDDSSPDAGRIVRWEYREDQPELPFESQTFDAIVCSGFLEYVSDRVSFLHTVRERLTKGGVLVASFINFRRLDRAIARRLTRLGLPLAKVYHPQWRAPTGFHQLSRMITAAGLNLRGVIPLSARSVGQAPLRLAVLPPEGLYELIRVPYRFVTSQALFVCFRNGARWDTRHVEVP